MKNSTLCPSDNRQAVDQSGFWDSNGIEWDAHRIGWLIAGVCAAVVCTISHVRLRRPPADRKCAHRQSYSPPSMLASTARKHTGSAKLSYFLNILRMKTLHKSRRATPDVSSNDLILPSEPLLNERQQHPNIVHARSLRRHLLLLLPLLPKLHILRPHRNRYVLAFTIAHVLC